MNGSRLIAGCFRFIFGSCYAESTRSKFGVSAYSRINTVSHACKFSSLFFLLFRARSIIVVFVSSDVKIARFFLVFTASAVNSRTSLILINAIESC